MNIFLISLFITSITAAANGYGKFPMYPSLANADPNTDLYSKVIDLMEQFQRSNGRMSNEQGDEQEDTSHKKFIYSLFWRKSSHNTIWN